MSPTAVRARLTWRGNVPTRPERLLPLGPGIINDEMSAAKRFLEIDWLKGLAIVCVLLIHAEPLVGSALHEYVINRAVPVFVVLFGVSSELWWLSRRQDHRGGLARVWWRSRLIRLLVPLWAALAVWWSLALVLHGHRPSPGLAVAMLVGYLPTVSTGWFVTLILELVLLFPLVHWAVHRLGDLTSIVLALALLFVSHEHTLQIVATGRALLLNTAPTEGVAGFYPFLVFPPAWLAHVTMGVVLARRRPLPTPIDAVASAALVSSGIALHALVMNDPFRRSALAGALDLPLTVLLLYLATGLRRMPAVGGVLAWLGRASWGMYLGQLLVYSAAVMLHTAPWSGPAVERWGFFLVLLMGGAGAVALGSLAQNALVARLGSMASA